MSWKRKNRLLVIDVQNVYLARPGRGTNLRLILTNRYPDSHLCRRLHRSMRVVDGAQPRRRSFDVVLLEDCCGAGTDGLRARRKSST